MDAITAEDAGVGAVLRDLAGAYARQRPVRSVAVVGNTPLSP